jgi:hypothetical protein
VSTCFCTVLFVNIVGLIRHKTIVGLIRHKTIVGLIRHKTSSVSTYERKQY